MKKGMDDQELVTLVTSMQHAALGYQNDSLSLQRQQALDYYFGRPFGNEITGRSQVVERTLMEVVEWCKPQLMRSLCTASTLAEFQPRGPDDVDQAEQETDYVNYVIMEKNQGFITLHDAIVDTLLLKNGYIKSYWEEYSCPQIMNCTGLSEMAVTQLMQQLEEAHDTVEIQGKTEREETLDDGANPPQTIQVYDLKIRYTDMRGRVCTPACPAEELLISPRCRGDLQDTDFVGHIPPMTRSKLIEMGMDRAFVEGLPAKGQRSIKPEDRARDTLNQNSEASYAPNNPSLDEVDYLEAYVRVDYDGDGIAELRKVVLAGGKLPPGSEWNEETEEVPFSYGVITRMPHRHIGISLADFVEDIQLIRSTLLRQGLDNTYQSNNQRPIISNKVDIGDIALTAPGAPIRVDTDAPDAAGHITWAQPTPILGQLMPILDYMEDRKEQRTGIGRANTIIDSDVLKDSANDVVTTALNAANQRVEMYLRMLAETLVRDWVQRVHGLLIRHQQEPETVQLRGKWVNVNPRDWQTRDHLTVTVGLGMGSADEKRQNLMLIGTAQQAGNAAGIVSPKNAYNLATDLVKQTGSKARDRYFTDPESPEGQQMAQAKQQQAQQAQQLPMLIEQVKGQVKTQQMQLQAQLDAKQSALDHQLQVGQLNSEQHAQALKIVAQQRAESQKAALDHSNNESEIILNALAKIVAGALMGKAQPQQISQDIDAAKGALNG